MKKKIIILIAVLIIISISIITVILKINHKAIIEQDTSDIPLPADKPTEIEDEIVRVNTKMEYYNIKTCLTKFFDYCYGVSRNNEQEDLAKILYSMLNEDYINKYNISMNNILVRLGKYEDSIITINEMYVIQKTTNVYTYFVFGTFRNVKTSKISNMQVMLEIDLKNNTFSIALDEYMLDNNYLNFTENMSMDIKKIEQILNKEYNTFNKETIEPKEYVKDLFEHYKNNAIFNPEFSYKCLNEEYANKKFGTIDNYKKYVDERKLLNCSITKYLINEYDGYTEYVCIDNFQNYYIFTASSVMNYKVVLDTYTISLPEFIEKYELATEKGKVVLNIEKFIGSLNDKDYNYAYNCLYNEFRHNSFATQEQFKQYIEDNTYKKMNVTYKECVNEGNIFICYIELLNNSDTNEVINMQVIMRLLENFEFEMSFSII